DERVHFPYEREGAVLRAGHGIPFGAAISCLFANIYLTEMDRALCALPGLHYFRYADDLLAFSSSRQTALRAAQLMDHELARLHLVSKPSHHCQLLFAERGEPDACFLPATRFRHLGLEFRAGGSVGLSRDKFRKILNLYRYAFRRQARKFRQLRDPIKRAQLAVALARRTLEQGVRNVAIVDYYLRHVEDEGQLRLVDRWLAEEVLHLALGNGHRRGHFRVLSFRELRAMGLPSLVHRRRLIRHRRIESPFFVWKQYQSVRASKGTAARPRAAAAFSSLPEAAAAKAS
ncbi:MAG: reverse transcriptase domain-containing protein, partial [Terriglobales bacterium]